jgi:hypothetical protein
MTAELNLSPYTLFRSIVEAATLADQKGYWPDEQPIGESAADHMLRFLSLLCASDGDINAKELDVFDALFAAAGERQPQDYLRELVASTADAIGEDPDELSDFLTETPAYLEAIMDMDRAEGTRAASRAVAALSGLALTILAADGREEVEEHAIFTTHIGHLRRELDEAGLNAED